MPLTPEQVRQRVVTQTTEEYEKFMKRVDDAIMVNALAKGVENIVASIDTRNIPKFISDKAINTLRSYGWDARYISDQRDGDFIQVKYKEPVSHSHSQDDWFYERW